MSIFNRDSSFNRREKPSVFGGDSSFDLRSYLLEKCNVDICYKSETDKRIVDMIMKEFCRRINDATPNIEDWIVYCVSELECEINDVLYLLKNNGILFEMKTQQLTRLLIGM